MPPALPFVKPETAISLENIQSIATDQAISVSERITILQLALTQQLTDLDAVYSEIAIIEGLIVQLEGDLESALLLITSLQDDIKAANSALKTAKEKEARANRQLQQNYDELDEAKDGFRNCGVLDIFCKENHRKWIRAVDDMVAESRRNLYNREQTRKSCEDKLNSVMEAMAAYKESSVDPIRLELEAEKQNLNIWTISYSAAENLIDALKNTIIKLEEL